LLLLLITDAVIDYWLLLLLAVWCVNVGESVVIREMLSNRHLVRMVCHLDTTRRPDVDVEAAMQEPIFTEFVDECLRIVEPHSNWFTFHWRCNFGKKRYVTFKYCCL